MKGLNGIEVSDRTDYNEYLTAKENTKISRETFMSADEIMNEDEKTIEE